MKKLIIVRPPNKFVIAPIDIISIQESWQSKLNNFIVAILCGENNKDITTFEIIEL
jgi:hypothetical protein